ncbi:MAG: hypothetical protein MUP98_02475 [Candidatus Aminicenantes bacterium]|nr:hypothetical protein [Candidatus Aminicenantes bacterium]
MKKTLLILFAFLFCLCSASAVLGQRGEEDSSNTRIDPSLFNGLKYRNIGPSRGGRVTTVAGIPSQPGTFYMGACGGGVWKTTDYGISWDNVSDGYFSTGSIGAIRVAPSDADIVYVGTGSDGIRSNVIKGLGVYKSIDSGKTWIFLGLREVGQIGAVEIHPGNPDIAYVAALGQAFGPNPERGVFRTLDGGKTWEKILFVSDKTGGIDLEFAPDNPDIIYASLWRGERKPWTIISGGNEGGVYKSSDGGESWKQVTTGLPPGLRGKSDLAVSQTDPRRVYVLMEAPEGEGGLYRSDDYGESFQLISTYAPLLDRPFYYCNLDADPTNADVLYSNSTSFYKSTDAGSSWKRLSTPHGDNHDMWINPHNPDIFIQSNDGGANVTRDGGQTWSTQNNQPTAELYQVAVDDQFPYWIYAGQQDNSTIMVPSLPPYSPSIGATAFWQSIGGCETGPAVPKPGNHNIVYANCKGRFGRYNKLTGQEKQYYVGAANIYGHNPKDLTYRFQRVSPIHVSPHDPNVVYHASQYLHRTKDEGVTWETISPDLTANESDKQVISGTPITRDITGEEFYSTIYAVQESTLAKGLIWVGANDGPVHVTRDDGKTWTNVTPPDMLPGGRIQNIEPSPHKPNKAYFAAYRYLLGDWEPYIYRTNDYGKSWTRLTTGKNGIPADSPTRVVREDPDREGLLYAGTEFGMYISFDDGEHWQVFQLNLPVTPVTDILVYRDDLVLSTMGRSFWILDNITPLHQISAQPKSSLFNPKESYRMRFRASQASSAEPEYPSPGVMFDYVLAEEPKEDIVLEIKNSSGQIMKTFSSTEGQPRLKKTTGAHRFLWDMRRALPVGDEAGQSPRSMRGPLVIPGTYQGTLTIGGWSERVHFEILMDPRVSADGVTLSDLKAQEKLCLDVLVLQERARNISNQLEKEIEKLTIKIKGGGKLSSLEKSLEIKLNGIKAKLVTSRGTYQQPMILDQISYLSSMLDRADQRPGRDAYLRFDELFEALTLYEAEISQVLKQQD